MCIFPEGHHFLAHTRQTRRSLLNLLTQDRACPRAGSRLMYGCSRAIKDLATLANSGQLRWAIFASELSWSWPRPSSACLSAQLLLLPDFASSLTLPRAVGGGGSSFMSVLHTKLSHSLLLESPTCKRSRRRGSTRAHTSASGHWGNRPEQEPGRALISYHCRANLEQLSTQHRIWHTKVLFLEENNLASLLQFLPDNGVGLGEISLGPYGPEMGVTAMVAGNRLCSLRISNICL